MARGHGSSEAELPVRLAAVLDVLYLLFNEGYSAHAGPTLTRADLCAEAVRLASFLAASPVGNNTRWSNNIARAARGKPPLPKGYVGGHFHKNWRLQVNSKPSGTVEGIDNSGQAAIDGAVQSLIGGPLTIAELRAIWITNNLPYAEPLENGWSKQAPAGMVAQTKAAIEARYAGGGR